MSSFKWDTQSDGPLPSPIILIPNVSVIPIGDGGMLAVGLVDSPLHAGAWDALEEHGLYREVGVIFDERVYYYMATVDDEGENILLVPSDDYDDNQPDLLRIGQRKVVLKLRW